MIPRLVAGILGTATSLAVFGVAWNAFHIRQETVAAHAESNAQYENLVARRYAALRQLDALRTGSAPEQTGSLATGPSAGNPASANNTPPRKPYRTSPRTLANDPGVQVFKQEADRAQRHLRYATFVRIQRLSEEQAESLDRILRDRDMQLLDLRSSVESQGTESDDAATLKLRAEITSATDDALRTLLGDAGFAEFRTYELTIDLRQAVSSFAVAATMIGKPLSHIQAEQLVQTLAESTRYTPAGHPVSIGSVDWDKAVPRMQTILSSAQFDQISQTEPNAFGGSASRFMITFLAGVQETRKKGKATTP